MKLTLVHYSSPSYILGAAFIVVGKYSQKFYVSCWLIGILISNRGTFDSLYHCTVVVLTLKIFAKHRSLAAFTPYDAKIEAAYVSFLAERLTMRTKLPCRLYRLYFVKSGVILLIPKQLIFSLLNRNWKLFYQMVPRMTESIDELESHSCPVQDWIDHKWYIEYNCTYSIDLQLYCPRFFNAKNRRIRTWFNMFSLTDKL